MGGYIYKHYSQVIEIPGIELEKKAHQIKTNNTATFGIQSHTKNALINYFA